MSQQHPAPEADPTPDAELVTKSRHVVEMRSWNYPAELIVGLSHGDPAALLAEYAGNLAQPEPRRTEVYVTVKDPDHGNVGLHFWVESFRLVHPGQRHWIFAGPVTKGDNRTELHFVHGQVALAVLIAEATVPDEAQ